MDYPKKDTSTSLSVSRRQLLQSGAAWGISRSLKFNDLLGQETTAALSAAGETAVTATVHSPYAVMRSLNMDAVSWTGGFWNKRFQLAHELMIHSMWRTFNNPDNGTSFVTFRIAAGLVPPQQTYATPYSDGDFYKWLEAVAHVYGSTCDPLLGALMDDVIAVIAKAQQPDGYISTPVQVRGKERWSDIRDLELYNMGHLMTAACIHFRATRKRTLLDVATRCADYLYKLFSTRPPALSHFSSNPSQIMGLVELYRTIREPRYLELAMTFVDMPGSQPGGTDDRQDRVPLRQAKAAVGHAVIGQYLFAGASDVLAEKSDPALNVAIQRLWKDVAFRKMYLTGGVGAQHVGFSFAEKNGVEMRVDIVNEAFGVPYELPSRTAYNETCANIANALWNWRLLTLTGDARHADIVERVFYNSLLSGVSLGGTEYFYSNPLRRDLAKPLQHNDTLVRWPDTASRRTSGARYAPACCCPPNALRMIASIHEYAYSFSGAGLWVHLYGTNEVTTPLAQGYAHFEQETEYPWEGRITLKAGSKVRGRFAVRLRIPEWAAGASLKVNGTPYSGELPPASYAAVIREWKPDDHVELVLPMDVKLIVAAPEVDDTRGQVAVMRGPIVYCMESTDVPAGIPIAELAIRIGDAMEIVHEPALLGGVTTIWTKAYRATAEAPDGALYRCLREVRGEALFVRLIPYYAWANRGPASMNVWMPVCS